MTTQYYVAASLDGFIADRKNSIDWLLDFGFEPFAEHYERFLAGVGALVMGADTYEFLLGEGSWAYGTIPTWVVTHRDLLSMSGADIRFTSGDVRPIHAAATRAADGRAVWLVGGGDIAAQFGDAGLIDEIHLTLMPVVLGGGRPVLPVDASLTGLVLEETTPFPGGAVELRYGRVSTSR